VEAGSKEDDQFTGRGGGQSFSLDPLKRGSNDYEGFEPSVIGRN